MHASQTALLDALNRLGGRQDAPATSRDLVAAAPHDLPLVAVSSGERPTVTAHNVAAFIARAAELEPEALAALEKLVIAGALTAGDDPGAGTEPGLAWVTAHPKGVARQAVQWAVDHPDHGLQAEAFAIARRALE
ncbi:MAG: hypothetical protein H0V81_16980 [Solirubrobacterales bacterium]|nr:hypothetical protein [Solirubrobacterales bacterium]